MSLLSKAEMLRVIEAQTHLMKCAWSDGRKKQSSLFIDAGGVWIRGERLLNADVPYKTKHPILLPRNHHLTEILVLKAHTIVFQNGIRETLIKYTCRSETGSPQVPRVQERFEVRTYSALCHLHCQTFKSKWALSSPLLEVT